MKVQSLVYDKLFGRRINVNVYKYRKSKNISVPVMEENLIASLNSNLYTDLIICIDSYMTV